MPRGRIEIQIEGDLEKDPRTYFIKDLIVDFDEWFLQNVGRSVIPDDEVQKLLGQSSKKCSKKYHIMMNKNEMLNVYKTLLREKIITPHEGFEYSITSNSVRSSSGVLPVSIALSGSGMSCAYDCKYCPNEPGISRSYLSTEGTYILGISEDFSITYQVLRRLLINELMGHHIDKIEFIMLGGTYHSYSAEYRKQVPTELFYACNIYPEISPKLNGTHSGLIVDWLKSKPLSAGKSLTDVIDVSEIRKIGTLEEEKEINQHVSHAHVIGIVLETRPDQLLNRASLRMLRSFGCTRIQMGVQQTCERVLKIIDRRHGVKESIDAIKNLRNAGFKIDIHIMPDLPGSTDNDDRDMLHRIFFSEDLQSDYCKLYPCLDVSMTEIRKWKERGANLPHEEALRIQKIMQTDPDLISERDYVWLARAEHDFKTFFETILYAHLIIPPWTRINRVQRDFPPANRAEGGLGYESDFINTNLQQEIHNELRKRGVKCYDIRAREVRNKFPENYAERARLFVRSYSTGDGTEYFLSIEIPNEERLSIDDAMLLGHLRLRIPHEAVQTFGTKPEPVADIRLGEFTSVGTAIIREIHVYGKAKGVTVNGATLGAPQHLGIGKFLIILAEEIASSAGITRMAVISGVGVRSYYEKRGYKLGTSRNGEYMVKDRIGTNQNIHQLFNRNYNMNNICNLAIKMRSLRNVMYGINESMIPKMDNYHEYPYYPKADLLVF